MRNCQVELRDGINLYLSAAAFSDDSCQPRWCHCAEVLNEDAAWKVKTCNSMMFALKAPYIWCKVFFSFVVWCVCVCTRTEEFITETWTCSSFPSYEPFRTCFDWLQRTMRKLSMSRCCSGGGLAQRCCCGPTKAGHAGGEEVRHSKAKYHQCDGVGVKQRPFNFVDAGSSIARVRDICHVLALGAFPVYAMCVSLTL